MTTQEEEALRRKFRGPKWIAWFLLIGSLGLLLSSVYPIVINSASAKEIGHEYVTVDTKYGPVEFVCFIRESYPRSGPSCTPIEDLK